MKFARIVSNTAVDTRTIPPNGFFTPDVVAQFVPVPDQVQDGWLRDPVTNIWSAPPAPPTPAPTVPALPILTPMRFYLTFTSDERIAIKNSADQKVKEFWATYELSVQTNSPIDPNLQSVVNDLNYLATPAPNGPGILAAGRVDQILHGVPQ